MKLIVLFLAITICACSSGADTTYIPGPPNYVEVVDCGSEAAPTLDPKTYQAEERKLAGESSGPPPSTGLGAATDGSCNTPGWTLVHGGGYCEHACGAGALSVVDVQSTSNPDAGIDPAVIALGIDIGQNNSTEGGVNTPVIQSVEYDRVYPGIAIDDKQICVTNVCPPPRSIRPEFVAAMYIPFHCAKGITCDCLPPDICGTGKCSRIDGNDVVCSCHGASQ